MTQYNPMHYARHPNAQPVCGINEAWRKPGEPERFVNSTRETEKVECFQCKRWLGDEGMLAHQPNRV